MNAHNARMITPARAAVAAIACLALLGGCRKPTPEPPATPPPASGTPGAQGPGGRGVAAEAMPGIRLRLADADPAAAAGDADSVRTVEGEPLDEARLAELLERVPVLLPDASAAVDFAVRPGPPPPAIAGDTLPVAFPPPATAAPPPDMASGPLEVARYQPEGDVDIASHVAVTFSGPFAPLASNALLDAVDVPARLEPQPAGRWRWVGTQTLVFEPEGGRMPFATEFAVEVPAGAVASDGRTLAEGASWTFRTPPPRVAGTVPDDGAVAVDNRPVIAIAFDQPVDPAAVLPFVAVEADERPVAVRLATAEEVAADENAARFAARYDDDRLVALIPEADMPRGATIQGIVGQGVPAVEGPRTGDEERPFWFATYGPFEIAEHDCERERGIGPADLLRRARGCDPGNPLWIRFTNPLDPAAFDGEAWAIEPAVPGVRFEFGGGDQVMVFGLFKGRSKYQVTAPEGLVDVFGQSLEGERAVSFETGDAPPALLVPGSSYEPLTVDPFGAPALTVHARNIPRLRVALYRTTPEAHRTFSRLVEDRDDDGFVRRPPGEVAWEGVVAVEGARDAFAAVPIDLAPALDDGVGQVLAYVEPADAVPEPYRWAAAPALRWVQVTKLGVDVLSDASGLTAWVTDLTDGAPVRGASIQTLGAAGVPAEASTDGDGLARIDGAALPEGAELLVAARGADRVLATSYWRFDDDELPTLSWHAFDDRGLYMPGEMARIKGTIRRLGRGVGGDVAAFDGAAASLRWTLRASNGDEAATGEAQVSSTGAFDITIEVPDDMAVGFAELTLELAADAAGDVPGSAHSVALNIAEFRRPAFEVAVSLEKPDALVGERAVVAVDATYFAGGALAGADVSWNARANRTTYAPPGWDGFSFGEWTPWWGDWGMPVGRFGSPGGESAFESWETTTDGAGNHRLAVEVSGVEPPAPVSVLAEATVSDVDRQAQSDSAAVLVHPAELYVGLRSDVLFVEAGDAIAIDAILPEIGGDAVGGRAIEIVAERLEGRWTSEGWEEEAVPAGGCPDLISAAEPVTCQLTLDEGGAYRLRATVRDDAGRANQSALRIWVAGGPPEPRAAMVEEGRVELIPDKDVYAPGDTARILVRAPFAPTEALVSLRRQGLVEVRRQRMTEATTTIEVPIEDGYVPNLTVAVELVGVARPVPADDVYARGVRGVDSIFAAFPPLPAFASGSIDLQVPPDARTLGVDVAPAAPALRPGGETTVEVAVTGADGEALADAEVALVVVDEAVLALSGWQTPDPIAAFYGTRYTGVEVWRSRSGIVVADDAALAGASLDGDVGMASDGARSLSRMFGLDEAGAESEMFAMPAPLADMAMLRSQVHMPILNFEDGADAPRVLERTNLDPLAAFVPDLRTDATGHVTATITLPDNVTRYRITAVATDGAQRFGVGSSALTAALPLVIRPSAPRFLNFGDRFELPLVVQNLADEPRTVDVVVRAGNLAVGEGPATQATYGTYRSYATDTTDGTAVADTTDGTASASAGYRITVPADDRVELRIPAAAAQPGTAAFQAAAFDVDDPTASDAQRVTLPVWTPATTEAFATYGTLDDGAVRQPVIRPADVVPGVGGLEVTLSSTALAELTDAFLYLHTYPYECAEQIASRVLAVVSMRDVLAAFGADGLPPAAEIDASMAADVERLARLQRDDGGFGWWPNMEREADPFITAHVAHALVRARDAEYAVDAERIEPALAWLRDIRDHMSRRDWSEDARWTAEAQALYVRALAGDVNGERAEALVADGGEDAPIDRLGWLLSVLARDESRGEAAAALAARLENRVDETASTAQFTTSYHEFDGAMLLASNRRTDAIILDAWMVQDPESDLIPKLVRGLLDGREKGRWHTTQESIWALLALNAYFRRFEAVEPAFTARAWLDEGLAGEARFAGRSPDRAQLKVPLDALPETGAVDLTLGKEGPGRLYYRLGLRYAPKDLTLDADERGFSATRSYEGADDAADVRRTADGTIEVKAGARVRVRLTMVAPARRYHVALVDPLPAGLEAENPDLATTAKLAPPEVEDDDASSGGTSWLSWWWGSWYDHAGFRDDRVEIFGERVEAGVWTYTYFARATVPGTYVVPPLKAEEMYHPETYGRSATETVRVVP